MPFKHDRVTYGFPKDAYDRELINHLYEDLNCALGFSRIPVGIKLFFDEEEYNKVEWEEPNGAQAYCCMVEKATRGKEMKTRLIHHNCDGGSTALFLEDSTERIESGTEYFSYNLYKSPAIARRIREGVKGLYKTGAKTYGIAIGPISSFEIEPDVIIFMVNPYQAMRLQQGYVYGDGKRLEISGASMQALCSEITVEPYLTGRMNTSPLCPSTRFLAKWKDEEMAVGIPFEKLGPMVEGVLATIGTTDIDRRKEEISARFKERGLAFKGE